MPSEASKLLKDPSLRQSIKDSLLDKQAYSACQILDWLIELAQTGGLNKYEFPQLKGTSALDMGLLLLLIEQMENDNKALNLADLIGVTELSAKKWIARLRTEGMCEVEWVNPQVRKFGNFGKYEVTNWGIFRREVYLPFVPYVNMVINNWKNSQNAGKGTTE